VPPPPPAAGGGSGSPVCGFSPPMVALYLSDAWCASTTCPTLDVVGSRLVPTVTVMLPATVDWNVMVAVVDVVVTATFLNDALPGPLGGTTGTHAAKVGMSARSAQPKTTWRQTR